MNHDDPIRRLATITDEDAARHVSEAARADLAEQIMAVPPAPARRRRLLFAGVPLAALAACAAALIAWSATSDGTPHSVEPAALSFSTSGKYLIVKVKDPYADPKRYAKEFAAHGMKIKLTMAPVSPSLVGTVVFMDGGQGIEPITEKGKCWTGGGGYACQVGVKIPLGYHRDAGIMFGRPARPGEKYVSTTSVFATGEELHCVDLRRRTVGQALILLKRHKITVTVFNYESPPGQYGSTPDPKKIPAGWYVENANPYAPGQVTLTVQPHKPGPLEDDAYYRQMFKGCH